MKVYLSGKITGKKIDIAMADFEFAKQQVLSNADLLLTGIYEGQILEVVNPFEINKHLIKAGHANWARYMRNDIKALMDCDAIAMMPDWRQSKGARLEVYIARKLNFLKIEL